MSRRKIKRAGYQADWIINKVLEYNIKVGLCVDEGVLTFRILHTIILVIGCRNTEDSRLAFGQYPFLGFGGFNYAIMARFTLFKS